MTPMVLQTTDLCKTYRVGTGLFRKKKSLKAVDGVTLHVSRGSVMGLVGESGCGKSTLAKLILGLEKPTTGTIAFNGRNVADIDRRDLARRLQPVFQDPYASLNPRKSISRIISLPLRVHNIGTAHSRRDKVNDILKIVGLPPRLNHSYPNQLSGGQRQCVAVARALIMRPEVVVCDEPTSALDVSVQSQILNLLQDLRAELDLTDILISHDLAVVEHLATRVAVMYLGRIVEQADTADLFIHPRHPYTEALMRSVLTPDPGLMLPDTHLGIAYPNPIDPPPGCTFHPRCAYARERCSIEAPKLAAIGASKVACHFPL